MNFVFDINAAGQLISEMDTYSQNVQKSAVESWIFLNYQIDGTITTAKSSSQTTREYAMI